MSEQKLSEAHRTKEEEDENTGTNTEPSGDTAEEPPEEDGEPGKDEEGLQAVGSPPDVLETVEETATQADLLDDAVQLKELQIPQMAENIGNSTATVKVVLVPDGHVMTVAFAIGLSIQELKCHLASELRVPVEVLQISLDGRVVEEQQSLMELGVRPHSSTRMEMSSTDPSSHPLCPLRPQEHDSMRDVITVEVLTDEGLFQEVVVEIERPRQQKAFLGGYRHRLTGAEYHHAAIQTLPKRRLDRGVVTFSHDTQTVQLKSQAQQCPVSVATQMTGISCYISCMNDELVTPRKYTTADEYHDRRLRAVICLQSFTRRWLAQQAVDRLKKERQRRLTWLQMQERKRREEKEEQLRDRRQRWTNPERREDLNLLYHALEKWRREEEQQINSFLRGAERKAALCLLLEQETELIATIGRHHITFQNNNYDKIIQHLLDKAVAPHQWRAADGRLIEMDNLHTIRARELRDLYSNISLFTVSQEQRSHILMTLKHTVNEHKCLLTRDIVDLIDREVDLMKRGVQTRNLEGLRKRICTLFLQYIKTQAFNPAVSKLLKARKESCLSVIVCLTLENEYHCVTRCLSQVPQNPSELNKDVLLCRSCQRYLRSTNFIAFAKGLSTRCKDCTRLDNIARPRNDFSCYQSILRRLIVAEQQLSKESKIPFLLKVEDIRYLIEVVWLSQSALNASSDLYNLMLVRWEHQKDWSPWNCILLSKEEASAHFEVEDVNKAYEMTFIHKVKHKHRLAQRYFSQISIMAEYLDSAAPPAAALSNQLLSKPITMATHRLATDPSPDSAH
ncbi:IQ and ubiquitin-like domain-containing protein isoform X2 [Acanthochromis polyacanthus]|uniref:IQ and ubiquitin-like domain-containing protein isoform X2 n=1 Tax=Acanthochromis polyacanthus TaxID=80966 RepID=UPI002234E4FB|nr:IQ and ubiquitin-like domain-containing protein isoform X2 [Acanthochromis polyacanthus]